MCAVHVTEEEIWIERLPCEDTERRQPPKSQEDRPQNNSTQQNLDLRLLDSRILRIYFK